MLLAADADPLTTAVVRSSERDPFHWSPLDLAQIASHFRAGTQMERLLKRKAGAIYIKECIEKGEIENLKSVSTF